MTCIPLYTTSKRTHLFRCHLSIHLPSCYRWDGGWDRDIGTQNVPFFFDPIHGVPAGHQKFTENENCTIFSNRSYPRVFFFTIYLPDRYETRAEVGVGAGIEKLRILQNTSLYDTTNDLYTKRWGGCLIPQYHSAPPIKMSPIHTFTC